MSISRVLWSCPSWSVVKRWPCFLVVMMLTGITPVIADEDKSALKVVGPEFYKDVVIKRVFLRGDPIGTISSDGWVSNCLYVDRKVWDPFDTTSKPRSLTPVQVSAIAFGRTHETAFAGDSAGSVYAWNPCSSKKQLILSKPGKGPSAVTMLRVSSSAKLLAGSFQGGKLLCFWDLANRKEVFSLERSISDLAFSPNGKLVVLSSSDGLTALETGSFKVSWSDPQRSGRLGFSPHGDFLIVCSETRGVMVHLLSPTDGKPLRRPIVLQKHRFRGASTEFRFAAFPTARISPGGVFLAASYDSPTIDLWEMATMRKAVGMAGSRECTHIAFCSPTRLFSADMDAAYLWDLAGTPAFKKFRQKTTKRQELAWEALKSLDPMYGAAATEYFSANPKEFLAVLRDELLIPAGPSPQRVAKLIKDLDNSAYRTRAAASAALLKYGELVESALQEKERAHGLSLEARKRISDILSKIPQADGLGPHAHRQLRAVFLLERIGTAECRAILESIERDASNATVKFRARQSVLRQGGIAAD